MTEKLHQLSHFEWCVRVLKFITDEKHLQGIAICFETDSVVKQLLTKLRTHLEAFVRLTTEIKSIKREIFEGKFTEDEKTRKEHQINRNKMFLDEASAEIQKILAIRKIVKPKPGQTPKETGIELFLTIVLKAKGMLEVEWKEQMREEKVRNEASSEIKANSAIFEKATISAASSHESSAEAKKPEATPPAAPDAEKKPDAPEKS